MVFAKITGIVIILLGIFITLTHFGFLSNIIYGFDLIIIGIIIFILHELYALFMNLKSDGNKMISIGVPSLFILVASVYFVRDYIPEMLASNITLILAVLMCAEGLYRLH